MMMIVQVNTDDNVAGSAELKRQTEDVVKETLGHLAERITRVEVHLSDENSAKGGAADKRCLMEARLEGHQPIAVSDEAETIDQAIDGAAEKLKRALNTTLGRLSE
jgi:ribosome-associated translation inhibitor RaiA